MVKGTHEDNTEHKLAWKMEDRKVSSTVLKVQQCLIISMLQVTQFRLHIFPGSRINTNGMHIPLYTAETLRCFEGWKTQKARALLGH